MDIRNLSLYSNNKQTIQRDKMEGGRGRVETIIVADNCAHDRC